MGYVIVCRFKGGGRRVEAGVFLIDAWCLGVKDAFYTELTSEKLKTDLLDKMPPGSEVIPIEPCCARKLVEESVRYALSFGFAPNHDYKKGAKVFGGLNPAQCQKQFTFGKDGKPFFIQGPHDTPERTERIINQLRLRCGEGNYHFMAALGAPDEFLDEEVDEDEDLDSDLSQSGTPSDLDKHPEQRELAQAQFVELERESVRILDLPEARDMLLAPQEIAPFLKTFTEHLESARETIPALATGQPPTEEASTQFANLMQPFLREMAQSIFTPPRIQQLITQLQKFHAAQVQAGNRETTGWAMAAISSLNMETEPGLNFFLISVCLASIQQLFTPEEPPET